MINMTRPANSPIKQQLLFDCSDLEESEEPTAAATGPYDRSRVSLGSLAFLVCLCGHTARQHGRLTDWRGCSLEECECIQFEEVKADVEAL